MRRLRVPRKNPSLTFRGQLDIQANHY